jgi:uncharacterized protein (DUF2342 family)
MALLSHEKNVSFARKCEPQHQNWLASYIGKVSMVCIINKMSMVCIIDKMSMVCIQQRGNVSNKLSKAANQSFFNPEISAGCQSIFFAGIFLCVFL